MSGALAALMNQYRSVRGLVRQTKIGGTDWIFLIAAMLFALVYPLLTLMLFLTFLLVRVFLSTPLMLDEEENRKILVRSRELVNSMTEIYGPPEDFSQRYIKMKYDLKIAEVDARYYRAKIVAMGHQMARLSRRIRNQRAAIREIRAENENLKAELRATEVRDVD